MMNVNCTVHSTARKVTCGRLLWLHIPPCSDVQNCLTANRKSVAVVLAGTLRWMCLLCSTS
jgi:hypothetical protein